MNEIFLVLYLKRLTRMRLFFLVFLILAIVNGEKCECERAGVSRVEW